MTAEQEREAGLKDDRVERAGVALSERSLRAMRNRWKRDLDRLDAAWGAFSEFSEWSDPVTEVQRNLNTAIVEIDWLIVMKMNQRATAIETGADHGDR